MEKSDSKFKPSVAGTASFFIVIVWSVQLIFGYRHLLSLEQEDFLTLQPGIILLNATVVAAMLGLSLTWTFSKGFNCFLKASPARYVVLIAFFLLLIFISAYLYIQPMIKIIDSLGNN